MLSQLLITEGAMVPALRYVLSAGLACVVLAGTAAVTANAMAASTTTAVTSDAERRRVDTVKTPQLDWRACHEYAECAKVQLPLDYDEPQGATTEIAVLRVKARNQQARIGSLFVNPGGPGAPATEMALAAPRFLSDAILDRFDIVGFDPRGIGGSANLRCFSSVKEQAEAFAGFEVLFPLTEAEEAAYLRTTNAIGKGCSTTGRSLAGAMSTAEVARDMDVLRRAVGDKKLSYLGLSYGSAVGEYYANMFPDRVRAMALDGIVNPISWTGTRKTANQNQDVRQRTAEGAYRALIELLQRCDEAGEQYCPFAAGDPVKNFDAIAQKLKATPIELEGKRLTYADFVVAVFQSLGDRVSGPQNLAAFLATVSKALEPDGNAPQATAAKNRLRTRVTELASPATGTGDVAYVNTAESISGVKCTDGLHPKNAQSWPADAAKADERAPYFGRLLVWASSQCARDQWTVRDEDAYTGPFNRRTAAPLLLVGSYHDPLTNYDQAVATAKLLPNSRLLSSDNWGHGAYGTSSCVIGAIDEYLLDGKLPPSGTVCKADTQPFNEPPPALDKPISP